MVQDCRGPRVEEDQLTDLKNETWSLGGRWFAQSSLCMGGICVSSEAGMVDLILAMASLPSAPMELSLSLSLSLSSLSRTPWSMGSQDLCMLSDEPWCGRFRGFPPYVS